MPRVAVARPRLFFERPSCLVLLACLLLAVLFSPTRALMRLLSVRTFGRPRRAAE